MSRLLKFFEANLLSEGLVSHSTRAYSCLSALALIPKRSGRYEAQLRNLEGANGGSKNTE